MLEARLVKTQEERLIAEFKQKNEILQSKFMGINPFDFYSELFKGNDSGLNYIVGSENTYRKIEPTEKAYDVDSLLIEFAQFRDDVYIPPAIFFKGNYKLSTIKELYAFVVDLDAMSPISLRIFLKYSLSGLELKPNFIVNSGSGLHLYYVLKEPFQVYKKYLSKLKDINSSLQTTFCKSKNLYVLDRHSIIQPYRMVGSLTKSGERVFAYIVEKKHYDISELAKFTKVNLLASKTVRKVGSVKQMVKGKVEVFPNAKTKFYDYMGARIFNEVDYGTRYMSMFALAVVAWKSRIPKSRLEEDLKDLQEFWNESRVYKQRISDSEITKAIKGYNPKSTLVTSRQLEEWTGFQFNRIKRNGRKRAEHLKIVHLKRRGGTKEIINECLKENINLTQTEISKKTGFSLKTINTHLQGSKCYSKVNMKKELIRDFLEKSPNATQREISKSLNLSLTTVNRYLNSLK